jgi:DNA-binding response OmpR family regulator
MFMKRMLIIDDDADILEALEALLDLEGYSVKISTKPEVVDKIVSTDQPDMIIMDVMLSGKDGRAVVKKLKEQQTTKNIPVLMISAHPNVKNSSLKAGADAFLAKPFETSDLVSKVNHLIN